MTLAPPGPLAEPDLPELLLPAELRLTPEQFAQVCAANPEAVLELDANGRLIRPTPAGGDTGARSQALGALLWLAVRQSGLALKPFDSSTGLRLPDGSVASPGDESRGGLVALRHKMASYQANGARLGWLLLPHERAVEIRPARGEPRRIDAATVL